MFDAIPLQSGQKVGSGRFQLARLLGRGGMGEVWLAQDERLHEPVALKFLPPEVRADPIALDGLRRETARSHRLSHPNIVRIHDLHEDADGLAFVAMEYVDGPTLHALRAEQAGQVFAWEHLRLLLQQLCSALSYAHGEKVIHRDLKPANIMVDSKGRLKLADLGLAAVVSDSLSRVSLRSSTGGTLPFMSPQQLAGKRPQVTDDIYALGATLYELVASEPPFFTGDITHQVLREAPEPLNDRLAALGIENPVPTNVAALIMACLAKEPGQRPQNAQAVAELIGLGDSPQLPVEPFNEAAPLKSPSAKPALPACALRQAPASLGLAEEATPDSVSEEVLWQGKPVFWSFVPGLTWSAGWGVVWFYLAASIESFIPSVRADWTKDTQELVRGLAIMAPKARWVLYGFALLALWGLVQRVLRYISTQFQITTQRVKTRTGSFPQKLIQIDLREVKDIEAQRSMLGSLFNYGDVLLKVDNRPALETTLLGVPDPESQMERIRIASRQVTPKAAKPEEASARV
jgi:serine/threonine protein kinase